MRIKDWMILIDQREKLYFHSLGLRLAYPRKKYASYLPAR